MVVVSGPKRFSQWVVKKAGKFQVTQENPKSFQDLNERNFTAFFKLEELGLN